MPHDDVLLYCLSERGLAGHSFSRVQLSVETVSQCVPITPRSTKVRSSNLFPS